MAHSYFSIFFIKLLFFITQAQEYLEVLQSETVSNVNRHESTCSTVRGVFFKEAEKLMKNVPCKYRLISISHIMISFGAFTFFLSCQHPASSQNSSHDQLWCRHGSELPPGLLHLRHQLHLSWPLQGQEIHCGLQGGALPDRAFQLLQLPNQLHQLLSPGLCVHVFQQWSNYRYVSLREHRGPSWPENYCTYSCFCFCLFFYSLLVISKWKKVDCFYPLPTWN